MSNLPSGSGAVKQKRTPRSSFLRALYDREINGDKARMNIFKATYQTIYPNCSILNIKAPTKYLRRFSPDGRLLIAFSNDLEWIYIYNYLGCSMAADLLKDHKANCINQDVINQNSNNYLFGELFNRLFRLKYSIRAKHGEKMVINCSLFTENMVYAIVGSSRSSYYPLDTVRHFYSNNEPLSYSLKNYTIYMIDLRIGTVCDMLSFKSDTINLNYNQGINLYGYTFAVLSIQRQMISIYNIKDDRFLLLRIIGQHGHVLDMNLVGSVYSTSLRSKRNNNITGLKQKLLVFFFKKANTEAKRLGISDPLNCFYKNFDKFLNLCMWKMQLLDENHVLIRYSTEYAANCSVDNPNDEVSFFMVYNMATTTILDVYGNHDDRLLKIFEYYYDVFQNSFKNPEGFRPCSIANNIYLRDLYQKSKNHLLKNSDNKIEIYKKVLSDLPMPSQFYSCSPYLNKSLFIYDDRLISPAEISKKNVPRLIRFASRETRKEKFRFHFINFVNMNRDYSVEFTFHPTEPFAISTVDDKPFALINFHLHKKYLPE